MRSLLGRSMEWGEGYRGCSFVVTDWGVVTIYGTEVTQVVSEGEMGGLLVSMKTKYNGGGSSAAKVADSPPAPFLTVRHSLRLP